MTSVAATQIALSFEPTLVDRFPSLRQYIAHRVNINAKSSKTIAGEMDMAPSTLTRKLQPREEDTQRFNVDDLEAYLRASGDAPAVIEYLAAKFMDSPEARRSRALARVEKLSADLATALTSLKGGDPA